MSLASFFEAAGPFLRGEADVATFRALGPSSSSDADLAFYPWLVANDQRRILGQLFPRTKVWCERIEVDWSELVGRYVAEHPPAGFTVVTMGDRFPEWLEQQGEAFPVGFAAVADVVRTRLSVRMAPDGDDLGWDRRLFIRTYPVDPVAIEHALDAGVALPEPTPRTLLVYRDERTRRARTVAASMPMIAALMVASDLPLEGALKVPAAVLEKAHETLLKHGVLVATPGDTPLPVGADSPTT